MYTLYKVLNTRRIIKDRSDSLKSSVSLYILIALFYIRSLKKSCTAVSIYILLKKAKRTSLLVQVENRLKELVADGLVIKSGTAYHLTQHGLQTLREIDEQIKRAQVLYLNHGPKKGSVSPKLGKKYKKPRAL